MAATDTYDLIVVGAGCAVAAGGPAVEASAAPGPISAITSANTTTPAILTGRRAAQFTAKDAA